MASCHSLLIQVLLSLCLLSLLSMSDHYFLAATTAPSPTIKAVNLGGWLVAEGLITPWLFDQIPNKDLLDGTKVRFKSIIQNTYLIAENGGGGAIVAMPSIESDWETFSLWRVTNSTFQLKVFNNQFAGLDLNCDHLAEGSIVATKTSPATEETFEIVRNSKFPNYTRIRAPNGFFLQVNADGSVTADYSEDQESNSWGDDDPSLLFMTVVKSIRGEFQVTNGFGRDMATTVMRKHWNSFIVEDDFMFIAESGINAVRIPVGYWIANDSSPPWPFVGGSLSALDNALTWAEKHGMKVIIDLHAAPGAQSKKPHSGTRDGSYEWGKSEENIAQTVAVIEFLVNRYANKSSFLAMGLLNEPMAPGVTEASLRRYYLAGYNAVRKYSTTCYVIMSNWYDNTGTITEILKLATGLNGTVIDVHYYQIYHKFKNMTVQQNMAYLYDQTGVELQELSQSNGPLIFVGEWTTEWEVKGGTKEDYQNFAAAQLQVYSKATFGWSHWCFKSAEKHWSLEWMIKNGYMSLHSESLNLDLPVRFE